MLLVLSRGGVWLLEQPRSSHMFRHPRIRWLAGVCRVASTHVYRLHGFPLVWQPAFNSPSASKVWRCDFWMIHFGSQTPKRTTLISNSKAIGAFDRGPLRDWRKAKRYLQTETTRHYLGPDGKMKYCGTKALRATESGA